MGKHILCAAVAAMAAVSVFAEGRVKTVSEKVTVDGKLDEAVWSGGWTGDFRQKRNANVKVIRDKAEYILAADAAKLYFALRVHASDMAKVRAQTGHSMWSSDTVELFLAPTGAPDDFYQFAVDYQGRRRHAQFYGEAGHITPDPYAPEWDVAVGDTADGWCVEAAIPLASLYMTRNRDWKAEWLFNVGFCNQTMGEITHVSGGLGFRSPKEFPKLLGVPARTAADDFAATELTAAFDAVDEKGMIGGTLTTKVFAGVAGVYAFASKYAPPGQTVDLKAGDNIVKVRCTYPEKGRFVTDLAFTRKADGKTFRREHPVFVDFEPIVVSFSKPGYRRNFYPGQNTDEVAGKVRIVGNAKATLTIEGPGFAKQTAEPSADGAFRFDTKGFEKGEAYLTVTAGKETKRIAIRNLAPTGHWMSWVENGRLVVNGKPGFKRCLSAPGYMGGAALDEKTAADYFYCRRDLSSFVGIETRRLVKGSEEREATRDVKPSEEVFRKLDAVIEAHRDKDFTGYYLCDEPECRNVSPVYLQHCYEHIAARDPYHVVRIASRAAANFYRACDLVESHDYFNLYVDEDGHRDWRRSCAMIADHISGHAAAQTPDKVLGCYGTAFAYRGQSFRNDYPTFDEYVCGIFAGIASGAKSLQVYAYHDFADRPATYYGYQYVNASIAGLEDLLLADGETLLRTKDVLCVRYAANGQSAFLLVNVTREPQTVTIPDLAGRYREYRGAREFVLWPQAAVFDLKPLEVLIATSVKRGTDLPTRAAIAAKIDRLEYERTHRDNQLLERYYDIDFEAPGMKKGLGYKFIDGTRDVIGGFWQHTRTNVLGLAFKNDFRPAFDTVRVHGLGVCGLAVDVRRDGEWVEMTPLRRVCDKYSCELQFSECVQPFRMRLRFAHPKRGANRTEIYEVELPAPRGAVPAVPTAAPAAVAPAAPTEKPLWEIENLSLRTNHWSRSVRFDPAAYPWFVMDASFRTIDPKAYSAWTIGTTKAHFGGAVKRFENGLYTLKVPSTVKSRAALKFWLYNVAFDAQRLSCERHPANLLSAGVTDGDAVRPGATVKVRLELAAPREVFVRANVLGGALKTPILTNFTEPFAGD